MVACWRRPVIFYAATFLLVVAFALIFPVIRHAFLGISGMVLYEFTSEAAVRRAKETGDFQSLKRYLSHPDNQVRFFAILGLRKLATKDAERLLREHLPYESDEYNQIASICAILCRRSIDDEELLKKMVMRSLESPSINVRRYAKDCFDCP